jgi:hypothetical protein
VVDNFPVFPPRHCRRDLSSGINFECSCRNSSKVILLAPARPLPVMVTIAFTFPFNGLMAVMAGVTLKVR